MFKIKVPVFKCQKMARWAPKWVCKIHRVFKGHVESNWLHSFYIFSLCVFKCPQIACMKKKIAVQRRCEVKLAAFISLSSTVCYQMSPQIAYSERMQSHTSCFSKKKSSEYFQMFLKLLVPGDTKSHWLHLLDFSPLCLLNSSSIWLKSIWNNLDKTKFIKLGKTHVRILDVQPEFCHKGGEGLNRLAKWVVVVL